MEFRKGSHGIETDRMKTKTTEASVFVVFSCDGATGLTDYPFSCTNKWVIRGIVKGPVTKLEVRVVTIVKVEYNVPRKGIFRNWFYLGNSP